MKHLTALMLLVAMAAPAPAETRPTAREGAEHAVPLYGDLIKTWDAPDDNPFAPGHRGIDVAAPTGTAVRASAPGTVSFAGSVAGNRSVTVDHGEGLLTSYSFLEETRVSKGAKVELGTVVGTVGAGHPRSSSTEPHVHLSARRNGVYFDPIELYLGTDIAGLLSITG